MINHLPAVLRQPKTHLRYGLALLSVLLHVFLQINPSQINPSIT
jgi:hypothetical protein